METPITIVSADGHVSGPPEVYMDYIESRYREDLEALRAENEEWKGLIFSCKDTDPETLDIIDQRQAIRSDGELGAWDMKRRIQELDREGIACEVVLSGTQCSTLPFFGLMNKPYPPELRTAGLRAHHRWLADCMSDARGRFYGIATSGPCLDMAETVKELRWAADNGFVGVSMPGTVADPKLPPLYDEHYEPFWAACAELDLVILIHAGYGRRQGEWQEFLNKMRKKFGDSLDARLREALEDEENSPIALDIGPRRALWQMMLSGAFDRYANLRVAVTELRADWVPATLVHLDRRCAELGWPLMRKPSEYFEQHFAVTPSSPHPAEIKMRNEPGMSRFMFGADFPHPESTWPNTWDWIRDAFRDVPETEVRRILGENAIDFYRLDRTALSDIAQQIGPTPRQVLGNNHKVDPRIIAHFHQRARYEDPPEVIDTQVLDQAFYEDISSVNDTAG